MPNENLKTSDGAAAAVRRAALVPRGRFKVIAEEGISIGLGEEDLSAAKGEKIELEGAAIQALLNDGAIEPV